MVIWSVFIEHIDPTKLIENYVIAGVAGLLKAAVIWIQELSSNLAAAKVKLELRSKFFNAIDRLGSPWLKSQSTAQLGLLANNGLDSLDAYFSKYLPQLIYTAIVTPLFVVLIGWADLVSAITLIVTIPLIPIFMILIGWATQSTQQRQLSALTRLGQHFLEALRGLTTLRVFGRANAQVETMAAVGEEYRVRTMKVLRLSFLSGFALELLASLSVALIAVSIGLRLVNGEISLLAGLFVLLLAPEAFLPIRQVGANFHASAEGIVASKAVLDVINDARNLVVETAPDGSSADLVNFGQLTVVVGPSGVGKTAKLYKVLQLEDESNRAGFAWMPQQPGLFAGSVADNICGPGQPINQTELSAAMELAALDDISSDDYLTESGAGVSGGQAQRIALARAFYRLKTTDAKALLLDEPISAIDEGRAKKIVSGLLGLRSNGFAVTAISHQKLLIDSADLVIEVEHA